MPWFHLQKQCKFWIHNSEVLLSFIQHVSLQICRQIIRESAQEKRCLWILGEESEQDYEPSAHFPTIKA